MYEKHSSFVTGDKLISLDISENMASVALFHVTVSEEDKKRDFEYKDSKTDKELGGFKYTKCMRTLIEEAYFLKESKEI